MADSASFDLVCEVLERDTSLERLEARGTVRLALKQTTLETTAGASNTPEAVFARLGAS
jgi:hypothetical protein